jgi:hypothetical protein
MALAIAGLFVFAGVASADNARADGDAVGLQTIIDVGAVAPGAIVPVNVNFELVCASSNHVDVGQTVNLAFAAQSAAPGGAVVSATNATIGPVPAGWPADGDPCDVPAQILTGTSATVTLRAPTVPNVGYLYTVGWRRTITPMGGTDGSALSGTMTGISFRLDVVTNTPPVVETAGDRTVVADTPDGWTAAYPDVTVTDAQDDPDPTATCDPAPGTVLAVGSHLVTCNAIDAGGLLGSATFTVTVTLPDEPPVVTSAGDRTVIANAPGGWLATFPDVTATDAEDDPDPTPTCFPPDGYLVPLGSWLVTCTATDSAGNVGSTSFAVTVLNTTPVFTVADDVVLEADGPSGWHVDWTGIISLDDAEDDPEPVFGCTFNDGETAPLGTHNVDCSALDSGGLIGYAEFSLHVQDTTPPSLAGVPADRAVTTSDPAGAIVTFLDPRASDIVDPAPTVGCSPASGSTFPVGTTTVTCTATDASGNATSNAFDVVVEHVPATSASAVWGEPIGADDPFVGNRGRTVPVKVVLLVDGQVRTSGDAHLRVEACGGGAAAMTLRLAPSSGRWEAHLDTARLTGDCHRVTAVIDGLDAGGFTLELRGTEAAAKGPAKNKKR